MFFWGVGGFFGVTRPQAPRVWVFQAISGPGLHTRLRIETPKILVIRSRCCVDVPFPLLALLGLLSLPQKVGSKWPD